MSYFLYFIRILLRAYQLVMIAAAIVSWIPDLRGGKLQYFLNSLVDPVTEPVRRLLSGIRGFSSLPIDLSFLVVYLLISIILMII